MEIENRYNLVPIYSPTDLDRDEGKAIEALKAISTEPITDSDKWIVEEIERSVLTTTADTILNWSRKWSLWPLFFGLACCSFEMMSAAFLRFDFARFGMENGDSESLTTASRLNYCIRDGNLEDGASNQNDLRPNGGT